MFARIVFRLLGVMCIAGGLFIGNLGMKERSRFIAHERVSERVTGVVVGHKRPENYMYEDRDKYAPIIQYETLEGERRVFEAKTRASKSAYERGSSVELLVAPCPTRQDCQAELTSGLNDFVRKYMIILFGGVFIVVGGLLLWKPPSNFGDGSAGGGGVGF